MSWAAATALLLQGVTWVATPGSVTVGDTVVLEAVVVHDDPGVRVRTAAVEATRSFEALRDPGIFYEAGGVRVRHVLAVFESGEPIVELPEIELVFADGRVEMVEGGSAVLRVPSVLPAADSLPAPRWSRPPVARVTTRREPVIFFTGLALVLTAAWGALRRRVAPRPPWAGEAGHAGDDPEWPLTEWISAGEPRAVAAVVMARLRADIARHVPAARQSLSVDECLAVVRRERPDWPLQEMGDVLQAIERASFAPAVPSDVLVLVDEAADVSRTLAAAGPADEAEA